MNTLLNRAIWALGAIALLGVPVRADVAASETSRVVAAANAFLSTLNAKQRSAAQFAFDDQAQRVRWSNLPTTFVHRAGLSMGALSEAQRTAAMTLLASVLSPRGMEKVQQIMEADEVLRTQPNNGPRGGPPGAPPGGPRNGGPPPGGGPGPGFGNARSPFGKDLYYISFLGTPSEKDPWMLQFGGHHLALNITIIGEHGVLTPTLTGAQPAFYQLDGKTIRPLGQESDKSLALLNALDESQRKQAILSFRVADLVLGPGMDGKTIQPEGLKASDMNEKQRAMLLDLIAEWAGIVNEPFAAERMAELKADLDQTWFAWSGPTTAAEGRNITAYYRVQGPKLVIEYAPQRLGGDLSMHVHTMYRDPTNDYGQRFTGK